MSYVVIPGNHDYWEVGFYNPQGEWVPAPEDDKFMTRSSWTGNGYKAEDAKAYARWLNGGALDEE